MNIADHLAVAPMQFPLRFAGPGVGVRELGIDDSGTEAGVRKEALIGRLEERMKSTFPSTAEVVGRALDAAVMVNEVSGIPVVCYLLCPEEDYDVDTAQLWVGGLPIMEPDLGVKKTLPGGIVDFAQRIHNGFLWSGEGSGPFSVSAGPLKLSLYTGGVDPEWLADEANATANDLYVAMSNIDSSIYYCWRGGGDSPGSNEMVVVDMHGGDQHVKIGGSFEEEADSLMSSAMLGDLIW